MVGEGGCCRKENKRIELQRKGPQMCGHGALELHEGEEVFSLSVKLCPYFLTFGHFAWH